MRIKRLIYIMITFTLLFTIACKTNIKDKKSNDIEFIEENKDYNLEEFKKLLNKEDNVNGILLYIEENIELVTNRDSDKMLLELENYLEENIDRIKEKMIKTDVNYELIELGGRELFFPENRVKEIENDELRELIKDSLNNNYKLINLEGEFYPIIDYEKLKKYNSYISDEIKEYIEIKSLDSEKPIAIDASLYISYSELVERILKTENYIKKYSKGQKHENMMEIYSRNLWIYLSGMDNSPIYDYETGQIYEEILESYREVENMEKKTTGYIVKKYLESIEKNNYIIDQSIKDKSVELVKEALNLLGKT